MDPISVRRGELVDRPDYTGATLRNDGTLGLYIRGRGYACGPMTPDQLRAFAEHALAVADLIERRGEDAARMATADLERIVGGDGADA